MTSGVVLAAAWVILAAGPAIAGNLEIPAPRSSAADTARIEAQNARGRMDPDSAAVVRRRLLERFPGDGFLLREVATAADEQGRLADLAGILARGEQPPLLPKLGSAERAYLEGVVAYYRERYRTSIDRFEVALRARPDWGWAHLYRARAGIYALEPAASTDRHIEQAMRDTDCTPAVLDWLLGTGDLRLRTMLRGNEKQVEAVVSATPWVDWTADYRDLVRRLQAAPVPSAEVRRAWRASRERSPGGAADLAGSLGYLLRHRFPFPECRALLSSLFEESIGPERDVWGSHLASIHADHGFEREADSIFSLCGNVDPYFRVTRYRIGFEGSPRDTLVKEVRSILSEELTSSAVSCAMDLLTQLGRDGDVEALRRELEAASPHHQLDFRLAVLASNNPTAAAAVYDSLKREGVPKEGDLLFLQICEQIRDTLGLDRVPERVDFHEVRYAYSMLAGAARDRGRVERSNRLFDAAVASAGCDYSFLGQMGQSASSRKDLRQLDAVEKRLVSICPGCPQNDVWSVEWRIGWNSDRALTALRRVAPRADLTAMQLVRLTYGAESLGERTLADSLLARARSVDPDRRDVRTAEAWIALTRGDHARAVRLMQPLLQEFPKWKDYQWMMASAGGSVDPDLKPSEVDPFEILEHDLTSTDWIRRGLAAPDSLRSSQGVQLQTRVSYLLGSEGVRIRSRIVTKITTSLGVEANRTVRLPFLTESGPPKVRSARVVFPDGKTVEVPRDDIVVASAGGGDGMVTDVRHLVIPFAGLKAGAALDLVWEQAQPVWGSAGWSARMVLSGLLPVRESIVEVAHLPGTSIRVRQGGSVPAPDSTTMGHVTVRRWTMRSVPAAEEVPLGGNVYDLYPWVGFTSYRTWDEAARSYASVYWPRAVASEDIRTVASAIARQAPTPERKLELAVDSLAARLEYLAIELGPGRYVPSPAPDVLRRGYGDCKDMVTLATTLLDAMGMKSEPVLLASRRDATLSPDFPEPELFTHMVLWVPGVRKGVYCDLTLRPASIGAISAEYEGTVALRIARTGASSVVTLPTQSAAEHGYSMEIDVHPSGDGAADLRVRARFRGEMARNAHALLTIADTTLASETIDRVLGYGLPGTSRRISWSLDRDEDRFLTASATYRDTSWAQERNSMAFTIQNEVADPYIVYPASRDRAHPVRIVNAYRDSVVIRLHPGGDWEPDPRVATVSVRGPLYGGQIETTPPSKGRRFVEIRQRFETEAREISTKDYPAFYRNWVRFLASVYQPYRYRRVVDQARLDEIRAYRRQHPDDIAYAIGAVTGVLGDDVGGDGPEGLARRATCREMLDPLRYDPEAGAWPQILLASIEIRDGHYKDADSLAREALGRERGNQYALSLVIAARKLLGDREGERRYLRELARLNPDDAVQLQLLGACYRDSLDDEARQIETRLASLRGSVDSIAVLTARLTGYLESGRCGEARKALDHMRRTQDSTLVRYLDGVIALDCNDPVSALPVFEDMWLRDPINPIFCNNLAWLYAILGKELELAEEIAQISIRLGSDTEGSAENTLGAIHARRGDWRRARDVFQGILERTESGESRLANAYMLGLCDYQLGKKEEAVQRWRETLAGAPRGEWRDRIQHSLDLSARGGQVTDALFVAPTKTVTR